jgi:hypothetical protein
MNMCTAQWKRNNTLTGVKQAFHRNVRQLHRNDVADCRTVDVSLPISIPDGRNLSQSGIRRLDRAGSPDFPGDRDSYLLTMVFSRVRIVRVIASLLAIALSVQVAGAQGTNCERMNPSHATDAHQEMHHSGLPDARAGTGASHTQTPGVPGCSQSIQCMNAPAMVNMTVDVIPVVRIAAPIAHSPRILEVRTLCPDSPPPRN